jgi:hypothetical protein
MAGRDAGRHHDLVATMFAYMNANAREIRHGHKLTVSDQSPSSPRRTPDRGPVQAPGSRRFQKSWIPASAGMTARTIGKVFGLSCNTYFETIL